MKRWLVSWGYPDRAVVYHYTDRQIFLPSQQQEMDSLPVTCEVTKHFTLEVINRCMRGDIRYLVLRKEEDGYKEVMQSLVNVSILAA